MHRGRRTAVERGTAIRQFLLKVSPTPFFDSARKLLELGAEPNDLLVMRHRNSSTTGLRARVGVVTKIAVHETNAGPRYVLGKIWRADAEVDC
jgi:hypothetical protein